MEANKCKCTDENQCDFSCADFSIEEVCPHHVVKIKVICTVGTCETTVEQCDDCKKLLTKPKTEC